ncbi:MAG: response regulator [Caldilineaceae bacterium]
MTHYSAYNTPATILLVEDDEVDIEGILRAFRKQNIDHPIKIVRDGVEALNVLRGAEGYSRLRQPYLILLDINMPRMNGIEFLQALRKDTLLESSIVFVLTTSNAMEDKMAAYNEQVAGYLLKNNVGVEFTNLLTMLSAYWRVVEFPPED